MKKSDRVYNVTRRCWWSYAQAAKAVENCAACWVEENASIRALTVAEAIAARNERARRMAPLPGSEVPGVVFDPPELAAAAARASRMLALDAGAFAGGYYHPQA